MRGQIDFNCDLGEGCGNDAAIIPLVSSASIACGGHAGDAESMRATLRLCKAHGVHAGAHPSYPDRANFGRQSMSIGAAELKGSLVAQMAELRRIAEEEGVAVRHVKPHGALYNDAARDVATADIVLDAIAEVDPWVRVVGLANSAFIRRGRERGFMVWQEAFVERGYQANGLLAPRGTDGAVIEALPDAIRQLRRIALDGEVDAVDGTVVQLDADTVCLHGDRPDAVEFARGLRAFLDEMGIEVKS